MSVLDIDAIAEELLACGVVGEHVSHPRGGNIRKVWALLDGDREATFGLSGISRYSAQEVLGFMAEITGCSADIEDLEAPDLIDPHRAVDAIVVASTRLREAAIRGATLLAATGHPTGMLEHNIRVVDAYRKAGGKILLLREEERLGLGLTRSEICYVGGVACLSDGASLKHTHSAAPMEALLEASPWPDIVLGDHGFAGAAIEREIPTVAVMDINDHALAVPWAEHRDAVIIPLDDNRPPRCYRPSWRLFRHILSGGEVVGERSAPGE
jgi:hypothetical protein